MYEGTAPYPVQRTGIGYHAVVENRGTGVRISRYNAVTMATHGGIRDGVAGDPAVSISLPGNVPGV